MLVQQDAKFIDHSWRLVFVGKLVVGCYNVLVKSWFSSEDLLILPLLLILLLKDLLGHFPKPIPSPRKLFITLPSNSPKYCEMIGEFLSMTRRDQRCVIIISPILWRWFLIMFICCDNIPAPES